jgi:hypothetical protein
MWNIAPTIPGSNIYKQLTVGKLSITGGYIIGDYSSWKKPVRAATTVDITLYGIQIIDGVELVIGDRVLVKDQTLPIQNGIYVVADTYWYRADDLPAGSSAAGIITATIAGFINIGKLFICSNDEGTDIVGVDDLTFTEVTGGGGGNTNITWKEPVKLATTVNITLTGMKSIDGVTTTVNDRILVKDQMNAVENGIYLAKTGAWIRTPDFDDGYTPTGSFVYVTEGDTNAQSTFFCNSLGVVGTDDVTFVNLLVPSRAGGTDTFLQFNNAGLLDGVPGLAYDLGTSNLIMGSATGRFDIATYKDPGSGDGSDLYITMAGSDGQFPSTSGNLFINGGLGYYIGGSISILAGASGSNLDAFPGNVTISGGLTGTTGIIDGHVDINGVTSINSSDTVSINPTTTLSINAPNGINVIQNGIALTPDTTTVADETQIATINAKQGFIVFTSVSLAPNTSINVLVNNTFFTATSQIVLVNVYSYTAVTGIPNVQMVDSSSTVFVIQLSNSDPTNPLSGSLTVCFVIF